MLRMVAVVDRIYAVLWFIISFLVGIIIGTVVVRTYESTSFKPWDWKYPPVVINCYKGDLEEVYITQAMHYWVLRGHDFAYLENNPSDAICQADFIQGFIIIKKTDLPHNTLGTTQRRVFMGNIVSAVIHFDAGTFKISNVFEHEIGHALGYNHIEEEGHIMHPIWDKMSPKFWIPE